MNWSDEQQAIFTFFAHGKGHATVEAFAGTGKTTTIKEAFNHAPEARMLYTVFNAKNRKEAEEKITDRRVTVKTLHGLGFGYVKSVWPNAAPDKQNNLETERVETALISASLMPEPGLVGIMCKAVSWIKNTAINVPAPAAILKSCTDQDIDLGDGLVLAECVQNVLQASMINHDPAGRISFDDMVFLPVANGWVKPWFELVVVDEAQDMSAPQLAMARQASSGRVVVVGDSRQAIYMFRGAQANAIGMMRAMLRAVPLKLTTTYRCPKAVVDVARAIVPDYTAAPTAPDGTVASVGREQVINGAQIGDAVVSRLNAPLMPLALALLRKGTPARIEGRDVGAQLIALAKSMKGKSVPHFLERIDAWLAKQIERLSGLKDAQKKIEQAQDKADTLRALALEAQSVDDVLRKIASLFQDTDGFSRPAVVLSSTHKAKGLEWDRVWVLAETYKPGRGGEDANLYYVAVTRAKSSLFLVYDTKESSKKDLQPAENDVSISGMKAKQKNTVAVAKEPAAPAPATQEPAAPVPTAPRKLQGFQSIIAGKPGQYARTLPEFPVDGQVWHRLGNVILHNGNHMVCTMLNTCRARFTYSAKVEREIKPRFAEESKLVTFTKISHIDVSPACDPATIVRRINENDLNDFVLGRAAGTNKQTQETQAQEGTNEMKNKSTKSTKAPKKNNSAPAPVYTPVVGRSAFIQRLFESGTPKADAHAKTQAKYIASPAVFDLLWATAARKAKKSEAKSKAGTKAPAKRNAAPAKAPARKPAPAKAPAKKSAPARRTPAAPAAPVATAPAPEPVKESAEPANTVAEKPATEPAA